jgi:GTP-binding protein
MIIHQAIYKGSFPDLAKCPPPDKPEYAFVGRSNVGKSSLINMLCNVNNLAHVSKKPGKTQTINHYLINDTWFLVDLPGYGFALKAKKVIRGWGKMLEDYLLGRESLYCVFLLLDVNVPLQPIDRQFINWMGENEIPFVLVFTKTDRASKREVETGIENIKKALFETWNELPQAFLTSAKYRTGREELLNFIESVNSMVAK